MSEFECIRSPIIGLHWAQIHPKPAALVCLIRPIPQLAPVMRRQIRSSARCLWRVGAQFWLLAGSRPIWTNLILAAECARDHNCAYVAYRCEKLSLGPDFRISTMSQNYFPPFDSSLLLHHVRDSNLVQTKLASGLQQQHENNWLLCVCVCVSSRDLIGAPFAPLSWRLSGSFGTHDAERFAPLFHNRHSNWPRSHGLVVLQLSHWANACSSVWTPIFIMTGFDHRPTADRPSQAKPDDCSNCFVYSPLYSRSLSALDTATSAEIYAHQS